MQSHSLAQPKRLGAPDPGVGRPDAVRAHRQNLTKRAPHPRVRAAIRAVHSCERGASPPFTLSPRIRPTANKVRCHLFFARSGRTTAGTRWPQAEPTTTSATALTAWNAGFSRHPRPERAAESAISLSCAAETPRSTRPGGGAARCGQGSLSNVTKRAPHPRVRAAIRAVPFVKGGPAPLSHFPPKIGRQRTRFAAILFVPRPGGTTAGAPTGRTGRWAQPSGPRNLTLFRSQNGLERRLQPAPAAREGRGTRQPHPPRQPTRYGTADLRSARGPQGRNRGNPIPFTATRPGTPTSRAALPLRRSTPASRTTKTRRGAFHPEPRPATTRCAPDRRRSPGGRDHG